LLEESMRKHRPGNLHEASDVSPAANEDIV
jgi:hypothetical protein